MPALFRIFLTFVLCLLLLPDWPLHGQKPALPDSPALPDPIDVIISFKSSDGTPLEAKLSLPEGSSDKVPVVFYLHGAGARTYDNPFSYRSEDGSPKTGKYFDFHARELAQRNLAFFRMSKRGCKAKESPVSMQLDREIFSKATPTVLLSDYQTALDALRARPEIDSNRIVLWGSSEGTWMVPRLGASSPDGIVAGIMLGYAADNMKDTITWQTSIGPWRNIQHLIPEAKDGDITKEEHEALAKKNPALAQALPFEPLDLDQDGTLTSADLARANSPRLNFILKAIEEGDDDFLWAQLLNLSSAYLQDWWDAPANHVFLQKLDIPLAIFHGELDGTCRVEGVREAEAAFRKAGKTNLTINIYPDTDHNLNWTWESSQEGGSPPFKDAFSYIVEKVKSSGS